MTAVLLVGCGAQPENIWEAAMEGKVDAVKQFITSGEDVNQKMDLLTSVKSKGMKNIGWDISGMTPLCFAANWGRTEVVKLLIAEGANINTMTSEKITPLWRAVYRDHKKVSELLIEAGADVDVQAWALGSPMHCAAEHGRLRIAELLIAKGADVNARRTDASTALDSLA